MKLGKNMVCLAFVLAVGIATSASVADAAISAAKRPLQTYTSQRVYCGNNPGATSSSYWIDANVDLVKITEYSGTWAKGTYPNSKGVPVSRWFNMANVLGNINYSNWTGKANRAMSVYRMNSGSTTIGSVPNGEPLEVVSESNGRYQVIYVLANGAGYKMGWVPTSYVSKPAPASSSVGYKWVLNGSEPFRVTTVYKYSDNTKHSCRYYSKGKNTKNVAGSYAYGVDIASSLGTNVFAPASGVVRNIEWQPNGFGNVFEIHQDDGVISLFAHLSKIVVSNGQRVAAGQRIGEVGSTGKSTGNHLHFEFSNMNPYDYYKNKIRFNVVAAKGIEK